MADSQNPVVSEVQTEDGVQVDAVSTEDSAETQQDSSGRTRAKKLVYAVPEEKLTYPFAEGQEPWTVKHGKLEPEDFQTLEGFEMWLAEDYFEKRIAKLRDLFEERIQPMIAEQETLRVKLRESKRICEALNITDDTQKAAIADTLGMASVAANAGISFEDLLNAMSMLNAAKAETTDNADAS